MLDARHRRRGSGQGSDLDGQGGAYLAAPGPNAYDESTDPRGTCPIIFRLSQKLANKIKEAPAQSLPLDANPFADWSCHLFAADRTQYIILTNAPSLYSAVMHGRGITGDSDFIGRALECIRDVMVDDELEFIYQRFIAPASGTVRFSKALNRSVIASMNDLVYHAKMWLVERELSPCDASFHLNEIPMAPFNYRNAREVFKSLAVQQGRENNELKGRCR